MTMCTPDRDTSVKSQHVSTPDEHWRGPNGSTLLAWEINFRAGGQARLQVRSSDGQDHWLDAVRLEIAEPERVVFRHDGWFEGLPESRRTVTFRRV